MTLSGSTLATSSRYAAGHAAAGRPYRQGDDHGDAVSLLPRRSSPGTSVAASRALAAAVGNADSELPLTVTASTPTAGQCVQPNSLVT